MGRPGSSQQDVRVNIYKEKFLFGEEYKLFVRDKIRICVYGIIPGNRGHNWFLLGPFPPCGALSVEKSAISFLASHAASAH